MIRVLSPLMLLVACAPEVTSPEPVVDGVSPGLTCNAQVDTTVTISGSALSPILTEALTSTPRIQVPEVVLTRTSDPLGNSDDDVGIEVPLAPMGDAAMLSWVDERTLTFRVAEEMGLNAGVWDVDVLAADGQTASVTGGLTLLDPPRLALPEPALICLDEADQTLALTGSDWLVAADGEAVVRFGDTELALETGTCSSTAGAELAETCTDGSITLASGAYEPGVYDVSVLNPEPGACSSVEVVQVEVVGAPVASGLSDEAVCLDQGSHDLVISGEGFLVVEGVNPTVTVDGTAVDVIDTYGCTALNGPVDALSCAHLEVTLPEATLSTGYLDVAVVNPDPAACGDTASLALEVVAAPVVDSLDPGLECAADGVQDLTLTGSDFLVLADGTLPSVHIDGQPHTPDALTGCESLESGGEVCDTLVVTVDADLDADVHEVIVVNPDGWGCVSEPAELELVEGPRLETLDQELTCVEQDNSSHTLTGDDFVVLADGTLPAVTVGGVDAVVTAADDCTDLDGPEGGEICTTLLFTLAEDALAPGVHPVEVLNPAPADCSTSAPLWLEVVPRPVVDTVEPELECTDEAEQTVVITGTGFIELADGSTPTVTVDGTEVTLASIDDCSDLTGPSGGSSCTTLTVTLPEATLPDGVFEVEVTNPDGVACVDTDDKELELVPAPEADAVSPELVCLTDGDRDLTLSGSGFVVFDDGTEPAVSLGTTPVTLDSLDGCTDLEGPAGGQSCTSMSLLLEQGLVDAGVYDLGVQNPEPAECSSDTLEIEVIDGPVIEELDPAGGCTASDPVLTVEIQGTDFLFLDGEEPTVTVDGTAYALDSYDDCTDLTGPAGGTVCQRLTITVDIDALGVGEYDIVVSNPGENTDCVATAVPLAVNDPPEVTSVDPDLVCEGGNTVTIYGTGFSSSTTVLFGTTEAASVNVIDSTQAEVETPEDLPPGVYDITVFTAEDCSSTLEDAVTITEEPTLLFLDPPVTYQEISVQATLYAAGADYDVTELYLEDSAGNLTELDWEVLDDARLTAVIPAGLDADDYDLWLEDEIGCAVFLEDALTVEDELTVAVDDIEPGFGWTDARTATEITAEDPAPSGYVQFDDIPRVYLSPSTTGDTGTSDALATALSSVTFEDDTLLDAVVPAGLEAGLYDVLVINPDGAIGLLVDGYEVVEDQPPEIDTVSPASVDRSSDHDITIYGEAFDSVTVEFECDDGSSTTTVSGTLNSETSTELDVTVPSGSFGSEAVCLVRVTNGDDTYAEYASLSISSPSGNLPDWSAGPAMNTARRAPAAAAARSTATARYLYAIGGDSGSTSGALDTMEAARVSRFGGLDDFETLPQTLPEARTLAGVTVVGRHVFLLGGHDGSSAVDTAWRAEVLNPEDAPEITDVEVDYGDGTALTGGTWIYRVAVLYAADDDNNPDGESLPSDPFVMRLPDVSQTLEVTLTWDAVDEADGYRIYRSPEADAGSNAEEWLADVDSGTTSWTDDGVTADDSLVPREKGQLGEWAELATMSTEREAPCVATATDPVDDTVDYLYVAGGKDGSGNALDSIEFLDLTTDSDGVQTAGSWTTASETLADGVWACGAWAVDSDLHTVVSTGESWIYIGGGEDSGGAVRTVHAGEVDEGGDLVSWTDTVDRINPGRSGSAVLSASNNLYMVGGQRGDPSDNGVSTEIDGPPSLGGWNSLGTSMSEDRYLPGSAVEAGIFVILGGETATSSATDSVDYTNF